MKIIGLIGGMSWESTQLYYQQINQLIKQRLGGLHSAKIILISVNFHEIEQFQKNNEWEKAGDLLAAAAFQLQQAGADIILLCTNTMHKVADIICAAISVPFLHIADATATKIRENNLQKIALLGTKFTMEHGFYKQRLIDKNINIIIPNKIARDDIHRIIYSELCLGIINQSSREIYQNIIYDLIQQGAEGIILGCTEIGLLIQHEHASVPLFDTTQLHVEAAVDWTLNK